MQITGLTHAKFYANLALYMINEEKLVQDIVEMKADIAELKDSVSGMPTKQDINQIMNTLDKIATGVNKLTEDHTATVDWLKRHDHQIEKHDKDIKGIKLELQAA